MWGWLNYPQIRFWDTGVFLVFGYGYIYGYVYGCVYDVYDSDSCYNFDSICRLD